MRSISLILSSLVLATFALGEDIVFPTDAGVLNVREFGAVGDGKTDDTAAINKALEAAVGGQRIVYLPNGVYLISDTLRWPKGEKHCMLQGQSRDGTRIQLADHAPGFVDRGSPRAMIWTGRKPAQRFRNGIRNLTIHTGSGNAGAIALQFNTSNQGGLFDVSLVDGGESLIGLDMSYTPEIGPLLARRVLIDGFDTGIAYSDPVNSATFEHLELRNQRVVGIRSNQQVLTIRGLESRCSVPVLHAGPHADTVVVLLDAKLVGIPGAEKQPAVINEAKLYARNVTADGYATVIDNRVGHRRSAERSFDGEFVSHVLPWASQGPQASLMLPVKEVPEVPWDPPEAWANIMDYGAVGDASWPGKPEHKNDTQALQRAIDSGKTTVYLPGGRGFKIVGEVRLRGNVRRLIGAEGAIVGGGSIIVEDGTSPVVTIERIAIFGRGFKIIHNSSRTLVIANSYVCEVIGRGDGDLFLDDVSNHWQHPSKLQENFLRLENPKQSVWCRQINPESNQDVKIVNRGATLWILGLKVEAGNGVIETSDGGKTEVLGAHLYATGKEPRAEPAVAIRNSQTSLAGFRQWSYQKSYWHRFVVDDNGADVKEWGFADSLDGTLLLYRSRPSP